MTTTAGIAGLFVAIMMWQADTRGGPLLELSREWFDLFVVETRDELTGYLQRFLPNRDDALEVSQEAYLKVFVALSRSTEADHTPKALLYTAARNLAISRLRHQRVVDQSKMAVAVSQELQVQRRSTEKCVGTELDHRALLRVLNTLPPQCRRVTLLRLAQGLSQKEIASRLGIAVSTVEKHLAKGLHLSRKGMQSLLGPSKNADQDEVVQRKVRA